MSALRESLAKCDEAVTAAYARERRVFLEQTTPAEIHASLLDESRRTLCDVAIDRRRSAFEALQWLRGELRPAWISELSWKLRLDYHCIAWLELSEQADLLQTLDKNRSKLMEASRRMRAD